MAAPRLKKAAPPSDAENGGGGHEPAEHTATSNAKPQPPKPAFLASRPFLNVLKGTLAYLLAFAWAFWDDTYNLLQPRVLTYIIIAVVVIAPGKTVGSFLDMVIRALIALCFGSMSFALINVIAGTSYTGMCILLFVSTYIFSFLRGQSDRNFAIGIVGPLVSFLACVSAAANGQAFDSNYLLNVIYAFLVGIAISLAVNVLVFPEFADPAFRKQVGATLSALSDLLVLTTGPFAVGYSPRSGHFSDPDTAAARTAAVAAAKTHIATLTRLLAETRSEIVYSRFSHNDREEMVDHVAAVAAQLFALDTAFNDPGFALAAARDAVDPLPLSKNFGAAVRRVEAECCKMMATCKYEIAGKRVVEADLNAARDDPEAPAAVGRDIVARIKEDVAELVAIQRDAMKSSALMGGSGPEGAGIRAEDQVERQTGTFEAISQVNFFTCALHELSSELEQLHNLATDPARSHGLRIYVGHFVPSFLAPLFSAKTAEGAAATPKGKATSVRSVLKQLSALFLSKQSIFGLKCAIAVDVYLIVALNQPYVFRTWYLSSNVITLLIAMTPWVGQTNIALFVNLVGSLLGQVWAYVALTAWGTGPNATGACGGWGCAAGHPWAPRLGLAFMTLLFTLPMEQIYTNTRLGPLGLLALLSYSGVIISAFANRLNPLYDEPSVRLSKSSAVITVVLTFAMFVQLLLYPNLARQNLRTSVARTLHGLSRLHTLILDVALGTSPNKPAAAAATAPPPSPSPANTAALRRTLISLHAQLQSLPPLITFSSAEIRLESKFPAGVYADIVGRMARILDWLASAATSLRGKGFGRDFAEYAVASEELVAARRELFTTMRLLYFVFASAILDKQPLPVQLPAVQPLRDNVLRSFRHVAAQLLDASRAAAAAAADDQPVDDVEESRKPLGTNGTDLPAPRMEELLLSEEWMQFLSFSLAMRFLSAEIDKLGDAVRLLVGSEDPVHFFDRDEAAVSSATGAV
ncbi:hypothetical protein DFJ73DRAFT_925668 [Zopfochytrium polystomum]|nr:hypothetical protein DFJ73DRAFT_925668 [Zopfochytrium polystomum]